MFHLFTVLAVGFFLGMRHATDPDHVLAISTIISRERHVRHAALIGGMWGLGHTFTILLLGTAIILFNVIIPPHVGLGMEFSVGLMLVLLGAFNLKAFSKAAPDPDGGCGHAHPSRHHRQLQSSDPQPAPTARLRRLFGGTAPYPLLRPLAVGVVHGLAGSAAVALLVLTTIQDSRWAVAYLLVFAIGTMAGMLLITVLLSSGLGYAKSRFVPFDRGFATGTGLLSLGFGLFLACQIVF